MISKTIDNLKIIHEIHIDGPSFEEEISREQLLQDFTTYIDTLGAMPTPDDLLFVQTELSSMQILTLNNEHQTMWLNAPLFVTELVRVRHIGQRVLHLLKTGNWQQKYQHGVALQTKSQASLPLQIPLEMQYIQDLENKLLHPMTAALVILRNNIDRIEEGCPTGIFRKPFGIRNQNAIEHWFSTRPGNKDWDTERSISTTSLYSVLHGAVFIPYVQKDKVTL